MNRLLLKLSGVPDLNDIVAAANKGADAILIWNETATRDDIEPMAAKIKEYKAVTDIAFTVYGGVGRFEDSKKLLYAGAEKVVVDTSTEAGVTAYDESVERFGNDKIISLKDYLPRITDTAFENVTKVLAEYGEAVIDTDDADIRSLKNTLSEQGIEVRKLKSLIPFSEFKTDAAGLVPCVVQDYKTDKVLMVAYMNEESYNKTIETGLMTYYTRSRQRLWTKGEESGHFQYVKSLTIDCDKDTILAKVHQIGPACHTGNETCFFTPLAESGDKADANPFNVFSDVYKTIMDRKNNPKEGSYTNYLFDKGIDKILKKVGEECTEIVIAAKNPDPEEIKYEIADFLYHVMVLMAERGVTWEDITDELARRE